MTKQLTHEIIMRELVRLRCNWLGMQSSYSLVQYQWDDNTDAAVLEFGVHKEVYSFKDLMPVAYEMSLNDFSRVFISPRLASRFGPQKPTLSELLASAMSLLEQLKQRLGEAR